MKLSAADLRVVADVAESIEAMGIKLLGCHTFKTRETDRPVVYVAKFPDGATPISSKATPIPGINARRRVVRAAYRGVILECMYFDYCDRKEVSSVH